MADRTYDEKDKAVDEGQGQGPQVERALAAPDGTITIPRSEAKLESVDVADVDLLLSFSDGTFVIIPNGALDAISDSLHPVVFEDDDKGTFFLVLSLPAFQIHQVCDFNFQMIR